MKKKNIIIASVAAVLVLVVLIAVIVINVNKGKVKLFANSNYPCVYKQKDDSVVFRLKDKNNSDIAWQVDEESGIVEASAKGEGKGRRAAFTLSPKAPGITEFRLYKTKELFGFEVEIVSVSMRVNVEENETGMVLNVLGTPTLTDNGGGVGGKNTDNPYILLNNEDGTARVVFVKGRNDWLISDSSNMANLESAVIEENMDSCWVSENMSYDPEAEVVVVDTEESNDSGGADNETGASDGANGDTDGVSSDADSSSDGTGSSSDSNSNGSSGSETKPAKTAKDIENMTISDEDYENGEIDLSEYAVNGEIPEDVLAALDQKLDEEAKERGDYVPEESADFDMVASYLDSSRSNTGDAGGADASTTTGDAGGADASGTTGDVGGADASSAVDDGTAGDTASNDNDNSNTLDSTVDYSGLYESYDTEDSSSIDEEENEPYTIDPETGELIVNEDYIGNTDEEVTIVKETILTVSSEQYNTTEYIKVTFMSDGKVVLSISKKGPKK